MDEEPKQRSYLERRRIALGFVCVLDKLFNTYEGRFFFYCGQTFQIITGLGMVFMCVTMFNPLLFMKMAQGQMILFLLWFVSMCCRSVYIKDKMEIVQNDPELHARAVEEFAKLNINLNNP